jgi:hypothetical protein
MLSVAPPSGRLLTFQSGFPMSSMMNVALTTLLASGLTIVCAKLWKARPHVNPALRWYRYAPNPGYGFRRSVTSYTERELI